MSNNHSVLGSKVKIFLHETLFFNEKKYSVVHFKLTRNTYSFEGYDVALDQTDCRLPGIVERSEFDVARSKDVLLRTACLLTAGARNTKNRKTVQNIRKRKMCLIEIDHTWGFSVP